MTGLRRTIGRAGGALLDFALPPRCPGCGAIVGGPHQFCLACWSALDFLGGPACGRCGVGAEALAAGLECDACTIRPPACDGVMAAVAYGPVARTVALRLKYAGRTALATTIARLLVRRIVAPADALLVPVPLDRGRLWRRGYNQAGLIARALVRRTGRPLAIDALRRTRATAVLKGRGPAARAAEVRGAFRVADPAAVAGRHILLVDDVYTTGATANACAAALKAAGAASVRLIVWARVVVDMDR